MRVKVWIIGVLAIAGVLLVVSRFDWTHDALRLAMAASQPLEVGEAPHIEGEGGDAFAARALTDALRMPWSLAFLPGGDILLTERGGTLQRFDPVSGSLTEITGVPEVSYKGQGGLFDVAPHPQFPDQHWLYLSYAVAVDDERSTTRLARARLVENRLENFEVLYSAEPAGTARKHYGGRLLFADGYLWFTVGDRGQRHEAQKTGNDLGTLLRLEIDGSVPADNPFAGNADARPAVYSYGHRNAQGLAQHPETGEIWVTEHGPQGGDELNLIRAGANYGWPVITYGEEYGGGVIGEGTEREGMEQPVHYWVPSIATGGLAFYAGDVFPDWQGDAFVTGLLKLYLSHVKLNSDGSTTEQVLLDGLNLRLRDVKMGPDGYPYLLSEQGSLVRLEPAL